MQFFDIARVKCTSWAGGDWAVAARREKYVPYGWPAGGNGGKWGSIIVRADSQLTTLQHLHGRNHIKSKAGEPWKTKEQYGKDAEDLIIMVPVGTTIRELSTGKIVCAVEYPGEQYELLPWGKGGVGNMHFKSSVHQYTNFALLGEPWQSTEFEFELQLIADVALLGVPSVWKTSLLNAVSAAAAKTAEYHFTTLVPNLWVVTEAKPPFVLVDIPWLIEWAAGGKWLGNEFLRHVLKARIWLLVTDISGYETSIEQLIQLMREIEVYITQVVFNDQTVSQSLICVDDELIWRIVEKEHKTVLLEKTVLFVVNKIDLINDEEIQQEFGNELVERIQRMKLYKATKKELVKKVFFVSAWSRAGLQKMIKQCSQMLINTSSLRFEKTESNKEIIRDKTVKRKEQSLLSVNDITQEVSPRLLENNYLEEKELKYVYVWEISEPELGYLVYVLPRGNDEAEMWFRNVLAKKNILKQLQRAGVKKWDVFHIKSPYATREDRRIRRE